MAHVRATNMQCDTLKSIRSSLGNHPQLIKSADIVAQLVFQWSVPPQLLCCALLAACCILCTVLCVRMHLV